MAEYWKSTPKYWCKFCSIYVKDTKFERQQHEATGRHQGNIQRSLKGLHREQEAQQLQQQRAKNEVARLNGLVSSSSSVNPTSLAATETKPTYTKREEKKATLSDRKRQWEQLAAMGVALPEQARQDLGMAGEWKVVSHQVVGEVDEKGEYKPVLNKGVHKRKLDDDEEDQLAANEMITRRKGWGQTYKSFPGKGGFDADADDLHVLLKRNPNVKEEVEVKAEVKEDDKVKKEVMESTLSNIPTEEEITAKLAVADIPVNKGGDAPAPAVVFKKRKKIAK